MTNPAPRGALSVTFAVCSGAAPGRLIREESRPDDRGTCCRETCPPAVGTSFALACNQEIVRSVPLSVPARGFKDCHEETT